MLVITMKPEESVVCSNGMAFSLKTMRRGVARICIHAPPDVRVLRGSLLPPELVESALAGRASLEELRVAFDEADNQRAKRHADSAQRKTEKSV